MPPRRSVPPSAQAAVSSGGGCLSGYLLPPLVVLGVGIILAFLALGSMAVTTTPDMLLNDARTTVPPAQGISGTQPIAILFTQEIRYWGLLIQAWSMEAGLDPDLVATVMQIESCGDPNARSYAGAAGLFQVMPFHFLDGEDPYDPGTNAKRGLEYLSRSLQAAGGNIRLAFAGYNGGIGVIGKSEFAWADETRRYVYWAEGIYSDALSNAGDSPRLQEWLDAGGASLCSQAARVLGMEP